jgi:hypothetical protein
VDRVAGSSFHVGRVLVAVLVVVGALYAVALLLAAPGIGSRPELQLLLQLVSVALLVTVAVVVWRLARDRRLLPVFVAYLAMCVVVLLTLRFVVGASVRDTTKFLSSSELSPGGMASFYPRSAVRCDGTVTAACAHIVAVEVHRVVAWLPARPAALSVLRGEAVEEFVNDHRVGSLNSPAGRSVDHGVFQPFAFESDGRRCEGRILRTELTRSVDVVWNDGPDTYSLGLVATGVDAKISDDAVRRPLQTVRYERSGVGH